jgi:nicotinamidase-related amidase
MQVPKLFGTTADEIAEVYEKQYPEGVFRHEKVMFSMLEDPVMKKLESLAPRNKIVLYGCEAHVCVKQTCFELLEKNYDVTLVIDAISSMGYHDRTVGIESMRDAGAQITTF